MLTALLVDKESWQTPRPDSGGVIWKGCDNGIPMIAVE